MMWETLACLMMLGHVILWSVVAVGIIFAIAWWTCIGIFKLYKWVQTWWK